MCLRNFAFSLQHGSHTHTYTIQQNSTIPYPITHMPDIFLEISASLKTRIYISFPKLLPKISARIWQEEASFPQIARRSIGVERRFIEIPSRIEQRRSPRLEFQFRPLQTTSSLLTIMSTPNYAAIGPFRRSSCSSKSNTDELKIEYNLIASLFSFFLAVLFCCFMLNGFTVWLEEYRKLYV